jgi:prepilin-type N-terminal cleavage/methylation domain-containing protein/prepilin-type processing-associated H-X9-DG protein
MTREKHVPILVSLDAASEAMQPRRHRYAFTLIELLTVIAIIGILTGLTLAAVQRVRAAATRTRCANQLRQIGLALHHYHDTKGSLPAGVSYRNGVDPMPFVSWQTRVLPFLEQKAVWEQAVQAFQQDRDFHHNPPHLGFGTVMPIFVCPADTRAYSIGPEDNPYVAFTSYLGVEGTALLKHDGVLFLDSSIRFADMTDGTSQTLMVGERPHSADGALGWWYAGKGQNYDGSADMVMAVREQNLYIYGPACPAGPVPFGPGRVNNQCDAFHFWSLHTGGAHFIFCDGSVHFLSYAADSILPALATRAGGETVSVPD